MNITNDTPAQSPWAAGSNSHGETLSTRYQRVGPLLGARLTIEFAVADPDTLPDAWSYPYSQGQLPYLFAEDEDRLAWYSYSPGNPGDLEAGGYYVPTYDFGNIRPGESVQRDLYFAFEEGGISRYDPRYSVLFDSRDYGYDILYNGSTSLKISDWVGGIDVDFAESTYPNSNFSVFHNVVPEPATVLLVASGALCLLLRGRRQ